MLHVMGEFSKSICETEFNVKHNFSSYRKLYANTDNITPGKKWAFVELLNHFMKNENLYGKVDSDLDAIVVRTLKLIDHKNWRKRSHQNKTLLTGNRKN